MRKKISADEKISRCRTNVILNFGFFASLLMHLNVTMDNEKLEDGGMPTMATDGDEIYYHEKFVDGLTISQLNFVLLHEILHVALAHLWRRNHRDQQLWNMACDFVVNNAIQEVVDSYNHHKRKSELRETERIEMPKGVLYDRSFSEMSAEEVYKYLEKNAKKRGGGSPSSGTGSGRYEVNGKTYDAPDNHNLWDKADKADLATKNEKQVEWGSNLMQAAESMKMQGVESASLQIHLTAIQNPQKNWKALLRDFIEEEINDYSFAPPDRRYDFDGIMLPDFNDKEEVVRDLLFFVDTSGSMSAEEITVCYSEIQGAINQFKKKLHGTLLFFDYSVKDKTYDFDDVYGDLSDIIPEGGGGTSFSAVFEYVNKNRSKYDNIKGIIVMTDGECDYPNEKITKGVPVLWIFTTKNNHPPFGRQTTLKI